MNISGIRTYAGFYDYNPIESQEAESLRIQEITAEESRKETEPREITAAETQTSAVQEARPQDEVQAREVPEKREPDAGAVHYAKQYQPDITYELKGADSDLANLDVEKALSDMEKDEILEQYQFFVGENGAEEGYAEDRANENFFL